MGVRARRQIIALGVGLALWTIGAWPTFWALTLGYGLGAVLLGAVGAEQLTARLPRSVQALLVLVLLVPGAVSVWRARTAIAENEGLHGLSALVADRLRLEAMPAIAPPLVTADRPQAFFVHAPAHASVRVRFGSAGARLAAQELGEGLYRVEYDPKRDGPPVPNDGALAARISVDGRDVERSMQASTPLPHPRWFALSADRRLAATVSEESDELVIVSQRGIERRVPVGDGPIDCAFVTPGTVAVSHRDDPAVFIVDAQTGRRTQSIAVGSRQGRIAVSPERTRLAVTRTERAPELVLIDLPAATHLERVPLDVAPDWIAFGNDAETLVVSSRSAASLQRFRHSGGAWQKDAALSLGRGAVTLARSNDGTRMFVATTDYRRDERANLGNHFVQDQILTVDTATFRVVNALLTARRSPRQSKPGDVDRGVSPMGIAEGADAALLVAFAGSDEVWRIRAGTAGPDVIDLSDSVLDAPHGIAELRDGTLVVSSPLAGAIGLLSFAEPKPRVLRLAPDDAYLLAHNREALARRLGERAFYETTRSGISCQSCHTHADSDESAHNLGTHKLLPTLSVRGLAGTAPYLRDGSFASVGDLDHIAQTLYRGYLRRVPGRAQTLDAFVGALPRRSSQLEKRERDPVRERRGLSAFVRGACPTCHAFPAFTGLGQHLLRGVFPQRVTRKTADDLLDAPSLLSTVSSPPYFSDGRARTLRAVLDDNRSNRHGDTARLSRAEQDDLIAFLESL